MLKKLYRNEPSSSRVSQISNYQIDTLPEKKTLEKKNMKKNYSSTNQLKTSNAYPNLKNSYC